MIGRRLEEDATVQRAVALVRRMREEIARIESGMARVSRVPGDDAEADGERDLKYRSLLEAKERTEAKLERVEAKAREAIARTESRPVLLTPASSRAGAKQQRRRQQRGGEERGGEEGEAKGEEEARCRTWFCSFGQGPEADLLERWAAHKTDWDGIHLALGHDAHPPWVGRGAPPDGSRDYLPDYSPFLVNMRAATFKRLEHGFGVLKSLPTHDDTIPFVSQSS